MCKLSNFSYHKLLCFEFLCITIITKLYITIIMGITDLGEEAAQKFDSQFKCNITVTIVTICSSIFCSRSPSLLLTNELTLANITNTFNHLFQAEIVRQVEHTKNIETNHIKKLKGSRTCLIGYLGLISYEWFL